MMPASAKKFSYYRRLNPFQKRIYDKSDSIPNVTLPPSLNLRGAVALLKAALESGNCAATQTEAQRLMSWLCGALGVPGVHVKVFETRPKKSWGELHGLYTAGGGRSPVVTVWMRTAARGDVVAFRTFLRTMVHELMHHLDYKLFQLRDSFHTAGFFRRESGLVNALSGES